MTGKAILPDIRNVPTRLALGCGDIKITDLDIISLNIKITSGAEYALSTKNVNTLDKAVTDSMDSSAREDLISMLAENWFDSADGHYVTLRNMSYLSWKSYEIYFMDIDPYLELVDIPKQLVLELNYDVRYHSQIAFAQKFSLKRDIVFQKIFTLIFGCRIIICVHLNL